MDNLPSDYYINYGSREARMQREAQNTHFIDHWDFSKGTERYVKGTDYPQRGRPTAESVWSANQAKILFMECLKFFKKLQFILVFLLTWNKTKFIEDLLQRYNTVAGRAVGDFFITRKYTQKISQEIHDMTYEFLTLIGISEETAEQTAMIFSFLIETDNAYTIRLLDILSETAKEKLIENPAKELKRLLDLLHERDDATVANKFTLFQNLLQWMLKIPRIKRAFITTIKNSIFEKLQYDEVDRYWAHFREDYKCLGLTFEQRQKIVDEKGWKKPFKAKVKPFSKEEMDKMIEAGEVEWTSVGWAMKGVKEQLNGII